MGDNSDYRYENSWEYSPHAAYSDSKLAITVSSFMLGRKLNDENYKVTANVLHPGVVRTSLYRHVHWSIKWLLDVVAILLYKVSLNFFTNALLVGC